MELLKQIPGSRPAGILGKRLYRVGATAALAAALLFRRNLDAEFLLLRGAGFLHTGPGEPPSTVLDWFTLLQNNKLLALTLLNLFDLVNYTLVGLIFLSLFVALVRANQSWMVIALALGLAGIIVYIASNQALTMLSLSNQYLAATTDLQREKFLSAGQVVLAIHLNNSYGGSGIYLSFLLVSVAGLIISTVMLRSNIFSKATAYIGILANGFGLGYYPVLVFSPGLVFLPLSVSAIFLLVWYLLVGRRLWALGSHLYDHNKEVWKCEQLPVG